jgi:Fe-S oxidoreductase
MKDRSYIDAFDRKGKSEKICTSCGLCLQKCTIMHMDKNEAIAEHSRLRNGEDTLRVLQECDFCYNCNTYCPHGMNPMALIMARISDRAEKSGKGIPDYLQYLFIGRGEPSVFEDVYNMLPAEEQAVLDMWETTPAGGREVLFVGCTGREIPLEIEHSSVLEELPKYGPRIACCGELPFRLGDFKEFSRIAERTMTLLSKLQIERLVCYCGSCTHSFRNIWRQYLGVTLPFEVLSIWEWLWEKVKNKELVARRTISKKIALADSCYGSELGDSFFDAIRGLHEAAGFEVVELKNNRYDNLCCGMVSIVRNDFDFMQPLKGAQRKIQQVMESGAPGVACYCPGCLTRLGGPAKKAEIESRYSLEDILWAFGDDYTVSLKERLALQGKLVLDQFRKYMARSS